MAPGIAGAGPGPEPGTDEEDTVPLPVVPAGVGPPGPTAAADGATPARAFDVLYAHHAADLTRQAYLLTGSPRAARRSVERAFRLAWQRWPQVAKDRDPAGWVRAAAYEYALSPRPRPRDRRPGKSLPPLLDALLCLPRPYRRALLLFDGVGLGLPETAAESEATTRATANRLRHAHEALAAHLPELRSAGPDERSRILRGQLADAAADAHSLEIPPAGAVRAGSERAMRRWTQAAAGFLAVLVLGAAGTTLVGQDRDDPSSEPARPAPAASP